MCRVGSPSQCKRTYLSKRDLIAHINHRHSKPSTPTSTGQQIVHNNIVVLPSPPQVQVLAPPPTMPQVHLGPPPPMNMPPPLPFNLNMPPPPLIPQHAAAMGMPMMGNGAGPQQQQPPPQATGNLITVPMQATNQQQQFSVPPPVLPLPPTMRF